MQSEGSKPSSPGSNTGVEVPPVKKIGFSELPVDVLLDVVRSGLDVLDVMSLRRTCKALQAFTNLRTVWFILTDTLGVSRSLSVPPFRTRASLTGPELQDLCIHSAKLRINWARKPKARLQGHIKIGLPHGRVVQSMMFFRGGRHLLVALKEGTILCVELDTGRTLAEWNAGKNYGLYKWRILKGGRSAVLIMYQDGAGREKIKIIYLELQPVEGKSPKARFEEVSKVTLPFNTLYAITGEDIIGFLAHDMNNLAPLWLYVMDWRTGSPRLINTTIAYPHGGQICAYSQHETISILIENEHDCAHLYVYEIADLLSQSRWHEGGPTVILPPFRVHRVPFNNNRAALSEEWHGWYPMARTYQGFDAHENYHPLSFLAVSSDAMAELERQEMTSVFSQFFLPNPYHPVPAVSRTFYSPLDLGPRRDPINPGAWDLWWPILATEAEHAVWVQRIHMPVEQRPDSSEGENQETEHRPMRVMRHELKLARFPPVDDIDVRAREPREITDTWVSTLEVPEELDIAKIKYLELDDARGIVLAATINPAQPLDDDEDTPGVDPEIQPRLGVDTAELFALMYA